MKINLNNIEEEVKEMYKVGNVIKAYDSVLFLIVEIINGGGYALVNLTDNKVSKTYDTLEELAEDFWHEYDVLVNAEINVL